MVDRKSQPSHVRLLPSSPEHDTDVAEVITIEDSKAFEKRQMRERLQPSVMYQVTPLEDAPQDVAQPETRHSGLSKKSKIALCVAVVATGWIMVGGPKNLSDNITGTAPAESPANPKSDDTQTITVPSTPVPTDTLGTPAQREAGPDYFTGE